MYIAFGRSLVSKFIFFALILELIIPIATYADENTLRLLVWEGYAPEKYRIVFEDMILKKYGRKVTLDVTYVEASEEYYPPIRKKHVDLVTLTHHHFKDDRFNYISNGLLLPLDIKNIPRFQEVISSLRDASYLRSNKNVFGVPICQGLYALVYNLDKVKTVPTSWNVLWANKYKGKYVLGAKEYLYNVCTTGLAMELPVEFLSSFDKLNNETFKKKLRLLAMNAGGFWIGQDKALYLSGKSLSAGWGDGLSVLRSRDEKWQFAEPKEGSMCWVDSYAITWALANKPFLKKVAEEWINFLLTPEFQVDNIVREISQRPTITTNMPMLSEAEKHKLHIDDPDYFSKNCIMLPTYTQRDRNGLELLWEEAMKGIIVETGRKP